MFNLDEEELKKAAARMGEVSRRVQEQLIKDAMFGERLSYSPFVSTGTMKPSLHWENYPPPLPFRPSIPLWAVITSPYVVEKKRRSREKKRGFWRRLWDGLSDLSPWPYSPIEFYEVDVPAIMLDRANHRIICHPSLEQEIKKAVSEVQVERQ